MTKMSGEKKSADHTADSIDVADVADAADIVDRADALDAVDAAEPVDIANASDGVDIEDSVDIANASDGADIEDSGDVADVAEQASSAFELPYLQLGYQSVNDVLRDCEMRFMSRIRLPVYTTSVPFTHQLARCAVQYSDQDYLEINLLHEKHRDRHLMMLIRPAKARVNLPEREIVRDYKLADGSIASLHRTPGGAYHVLDVERGGWQYLFIAPRSLADEMPLAELVKAANSIHTEYPAVAWRLR